MIKWLHMTLQDGQTPEDELRSLFLEIEAALSEKNLLRSDFNKYRTLHFSQLCRDVFRHSSINAHG